MSYFSYNMQLSFPLFLDMIMLDIFHTEVFVLIQKFTFGSPFNTEAVIADIPVSKVLPEFFTVSEDNKTISMTMNKDDIVFGLGENMRGINKRGFKYISNNTDEPNHHEDKTSLYASHNFILIDGNTRFGLFVDFPSTVTFDIGYTDLDTLTITVAEADYDLYVIAGENDMDIIKEFRSIIGKSYVAPKWSCPHWPVCHPER